METCPSGSGRGGRKRGLERQPRRPSTSSFKRACVLFGIGEYLYGDEPAEPAEPRPTTNGDGRGEPRNVPRDRISFPDARAVLRLAKGQWPPRPGRGDRRPGGFPDQDHPLVARADRPGHRGNPRAGRTPLTAATATARGRDSPGLGAGDAAPAEGSDGDGRADEEGWPTTGRRGPGRSCLSVQYRVSGEGLADYRFRGGFYRVSRGGFGADYRVSGDGLP